MVEYFFHMEIPRFENGNGLLCRLAKFFFFFLCFFPQKLRHGLLLVLYATMKIVNYRTTASSCSLTLHSDVEARKTY